MEKIQDHEDAVHMRGQLTHLTADGPISRQLTRSKWILSFKVNAGSIQERFTFLPSRSITFERVFFSKPFNPRVSLFVLYVDHQVTIATRKSAKMRDSREMTVTEEAVSPVVRLTSQTSAYVLRGISYERGKAIAKHTYGLVPAESRR